MADPALRRHGPLDALQLPQGATALASTAGRAARLILRGDRDAARAAGDAFGVPLPTAINRAEGAERAALKLGPDEWLMIETGGDAMETATRLASSLSGHPYSLVDVSHRQTGLLLEGPQAALLLAAGCPLDLRLGAFPVGMATRTIFLKTEIVLWRQAPERFHVEVWRSFAPYLVGHLAAAGAGLPGS